LSDPKHVEEARRWLRYAREDLATAASIVDTGSGVPRQACWLAQQAAEKGIKAALVFRQVEFPRTHDLDLLCTLLPADSPVCSGPEDLGALSEWAVEARYPGDWPDASHDDARRAVASAQTVLDRVVKGLQSHGFPPPPD
jgi:HEPN domain-containing protein